MTVDRSLVRPKDEPRIDLDIHPGEQAADGQGAELLVVSSADGIGRGSIVISALHEKVSLNRIIAPPSG